VSEEPGKRRRWLRWLRNGLIALVAFALVAVLALQYWIVPWIIRDQVRTELGRRWRGEVELDAVNFSFFGPIGLRGLTLSDTRGAQWLRVESVKIELSDWPGLSPKLRTVEVDAVHLDAYARDGAIDWPIQPAPPEEPPAEETDVSEYLDLRMIRIDAIDAAIRDQQGRTLQIPSLELTVTPEDDGYRARLAPRGGGSSPKADALLTQAGDLSATMRFSRHLAGEEMALLLRLAGLTDAEGQLELASDLRLTMREMNPETLEITGWTRAEDGRLEAGDQPVFEDLQARLDFQSRRVEVSSLSAGTPGGTVSGSLQTTIPLGRELEYSAALSADKVPLALVRSYLPQLNLRSGWADVELDIAGTGLADIDVKARTSLTSRMQAGPVTAATGQMAIDARFTPPLGDAPLALQGQAQLTDWRLTGPDRAEAEVPKLELTFDRQSVEAKPFALLLSDHPLEVSGSATLPAGGKPLSWQATLRSPTPLPVPVVTRWVGAELPETSVAMDLQARGQGVDSLHLTGGLDWETLLAGSVYRAGGKTRLDVRLTGLAEPERIKAFGRVIASDFEAGDDADPMLRADEIRVNLDGRSLRLEPARLSTPGGSMRPEPGYRPRGLGSPVRSDADRRFPSGCNRRRISRDHRLGLAVGTVHPRRPDLGRRAVLTEHAPAGRPVAHRPAGIERLDRHRPGRVEAAEDRRQTRTGRRKPSHRRPHRPERLWADLRRREGRAAGGDHDGDDAEAQRFRHRRDVGGLHGPLAHRPRPGRPGPERLAG
jgi:hypothetical protein